MDPDAPDRLHAQAVANRQGFATYGINRYHPELMARRRAAAQALAEAPAGDEPATP